MASLDEAIERVKRAIKRFEQGEHPDEETTRGKLIDPILNALEWDIHDDLLVKTQYKVPGPESRKVDYALFDDDERPIAFVEAKKLHNSLGSNEQRQLEDYVRSLGAHIRNFTAVYGGKHLSNFRVAVLTNGRVWKFYPVDAGETDSGWVYSIDLVTGDASECRDDLERFMSRERMLNREAKKALETKILRAKAAAGWKKLLRNPPDELLKLVKGRLDVGGREVSSEVIRHVIAGTGGVSPSEVTRAVPPASPVANRPASLGMSEAERGHATSASDSGGWGKTTIIVVYKGQEIGGVNQRGKPTLKEVLRRIVEDYGAESLVEACKRMGWRTKDPATVKERYRKKWLPLSDSASVILDFNVGSMKRQLDGLSAELGLGDQLQTRVIEIATGKQVETRATAEHAPWTKLQVTYKRRLVAEPSRHKTIAEVLRLIFAEFGEDEFIKAYSGAVITSAEAASRNNAKEWVDLSADVSVNVGWLVKEVADRFDRLADALKIPGQIKSKFVPMDDPRGEIRVRVDGNEYASNLSGVSGASVLMNALSDVVAMPEIQGIDLAAVCAEHSIIRRKRTWIISDAEFMEVEAKYQKGYRRIGHTNYMVAVSSNTHTKARHLRRLADSLGVGGRVKIWFRGELVE